jgi:glycosyltransferase involved in cell wall biosynthesis
MPRVLVVAYFFPPLGGGGVHRPLAWARYLPEHDWNVTVIASAPGGYFIDDATLLSRIPAATEVIRVAAPTAVALWRRHLAPSPAGAVAEPSPRPTRRGPMRGLVRRDDALRALARFAFLPDSYRAWTGPAVRAGRARIARGDIDAVLSTSPPESCHLVGEALARPADGRALPWLADFRDPWVGLHYRTPPTPIHLALQKRLERRVLTRADRVLVASHTHERALEGTLPADQIRARVRFLPNGAELEELEANGDGAHGPLDAAEATAARPGAPGAITGPARIVYTGTLVETPAMLRFLEALARRLSYEPGRRRHVELVVAGAFGEDYARCVQALDLGDVVRFMGPVPNAEARRLQNEADVLLLVRNEGPGYEAMVPGKLYEYLAARRPVVAMVGTSEASGLARACGAAVAAPNDGEAAVAAVFAVLDGAPAAAQPDAAAIESLLHARSRRALAGTLAAELSAAIAERR